MRNIFDISKSGLQSAQRSLSVTANNITNADTPGYSRQTVHQAPKGMQLSEYHVGLGVNITNVERMRHEMTDSLIHEKNQDMGYMESKASVYEQLETAMITETGEDLDKRIGSLFDNFSELSSSPQDMSVRKNLIRKAQQLTDKLGEISRGIDQASNMVKVSAEKNVDSINQLLSDLDELNGAIQRGEAGGKSDHSSLDIRTQKLQELSKLVDFESQETKTGALQIEIDGMKVLDENKAYHIKPEIIAGEKKFRLRLPSGHAIKPEGGELGGNIEMYTENIPQLKDKLDNIAATLVQEFNNLHNNGYGLADGNQRNFFNPTGTTATSIEVNGALVNDPRHIAASTVNGEAGNGELAAQIADMRNTKVIGDAVNNQTLTDYAVGYISKPGSELSYLNTTMEARGSEIEMLSTQQEQVAGVNIDEELSKMIEYQNAYQGAARVMTTAREMYDTLISLV